MSGKKEGTAPLRGRLSSKNKKSGNQVVVPSSALKKAGKKEASAEELIAKTMRLPSGWRVAPAEVRVGEKVVDIDVSFVQNEGPCPECGNCSRVYDTRRRTWRHLDLLEH